MKTYGYSLFLVQVTLLLAACRTPKTDNNEAARLEIENAEREFEKMASGKGIAEAFWYYADSAAVIKRGNDSIIHGKEGIRNFYSAPQFKTASVKWSPDFVNVSDGGDMGYTYGKYEWRTVDSTGKTITSKGVFHTVWKKQKDGSWKYVWD
jgi:ketosteroid isomerase-like protein